MSLTDTQKSQIRYMVSCNPTVENMSRIGALTDGEVLSELETFKVERLPLLEQEKQNIQNEAQSCAKRLSDIENFTALLNT